MANTYKLSDGTRMLKSLIDKKVSEAKAQKIANMIEEYGYVFCEECKKNDCVPIDCSHNISVKECQESGKSELAWDLENITMLGRIHHAKKDGLDLRFTNN